LFKKIESFRATKKFPVFYGAHGLNEVPCSQKTVTGPCPKP